MVLHRKRQRPSCPCSQVEFDTTSVVESQQSSRSTLPKVATTTTTATTSQRSRRERQFGRRKLAATSWKMTMATFLLYLCGSGNDNNSYLSSSSSSSMAHAWSGSSRSNVTHTTKKGLQIVGSCSKEDFQVNAVYLVCDSPGAYYRGSSTYRDSTTCVYGDKARLQLQFEISDSFTGASSIRLEVESGIYDRWKRVLILDNLCNYQGSNLQKMYNEYDTMTSCPTPGVYQLDTYFTVPAFTADTELHYTPDIRFRFYNAKGRVLGCATTGTLALAQQAREHAQHGMIALIVSFFSLICLFSTLMYLNCGRDRRMLADKYKQKQQKSRQQQQRNGSNNITAATGTRPRPPVVTNTPKTVPSEQDQRYHYFNGDDDGGLNGSSDFSNTSNAASSMSSHPNRGGR